MSAPTIQGVGRALPSCHADQQQLTDALRSEWASRHFNAERLDELHRAVQVSGRHLVLPLEQYRELTRFAQRNDLWIRAGLELAEAATQDALEKAGLEAREVDHIFLVTVTGISTPSLEARLINRLKMSPAIKRTPIFGLGCVAGAAGVARAADYLRGYPGQVALLLSVELCSLTLQRDDVSIQNLIATGLFGDGAAAVALVGGENAKAGPRVVSSRSVFYPDTERLMGWDLVDGGFKLVLSAKVPELIRAQARGDVDAFLSEAGLDRSRISHWVIHTGGPKVLQAFESSLELPTGALERSWRSLREVGNLSSASVLFVLSDLLRDGSARPGDYGVLLAVGPGFCSELVLLQW